MQTSVFRFGVVSWAALGVAVASGTYLYLDWGLPWRDFELKGTLIGLAIIMSLVHQFTAKRTSPTVRGILQGLILVVSIGIFGAAVALVPGR